MRENRIHGLDTLRSVAILLVFLHNFYYADDKLSFYPFTKIGWIGVALFFTLSGYLIANQILNHLIIHKSFSFKNFIFRRLMRTVPNYLVIVILYFCFIGFRDGFTLPPLWKILTFTSNIGLETGTGLSYTWSLCIEEQFYLVLPLILLCLYKKPLIIITFIIGLLISGAILRGYLWINYVNLSGVNEFQRFAQYQTKIYFFTLSRLDEILLGVYIAILKNYYIQFWEYIMKLGNLLLAVGLIILVSISYEFYNYNHSYILTILGFPLLGLGFSLILLSSLSNNSLLGKIKIPGAKYLALISFAIYIVEKPLNRLTVLFLSKYTLIPQQSKLIFILALTVSISGALVLYHLIELPFIKLRDKILPTLTHI